VDRATGEESYDEVIFACHPHQAVKILGDAASPAVREVLGKFKYADNLIYLHSDERSAAPPLPA
jgi:uncharacterized protein